MAGLAQHHHGAWRSAARAVSACSERVQWRTRAYRALVRCAPHVADALLTRASRAAHLQQAEMARHRALQAAAAAASVAAGAGEASAEKSGNGVAHDAQELPAAGSAGRAGAARSERTTPARPHAAAVILARFRALSPPALNLR